MTVPVSALRPGDRSTPARRAIRTRRERRALHPGAWWSWAACLALAASRTSDPLLLLALAAVTAYVVAARRPTTPWMASYQVFLRLGAVAIVIRLVMVALLGGAPGSHVVATLPQVPLPGWLAGVRIGGPISAESLYAAGCDGLRLAVVLVCVGAANTLTSPRRLLRSLPSALYEAGVALTVAIAVAPQAVATAGRIRAARRLRGRRDRGLRATLALFLPVVEGALERSVDLAAALDSRGFGRRGSGRAARRRLTAAFTLGGLLAMLTSSYALLATDAPALLGLPLLAVGAGLTAAGLALGRRDGGRTRHRPDPWRRQEWLVTGSGALVTAAFLASPASQLATGGAAYALPQVPPLAFAAVLLALAPAWLAPPVPTAGTA